MMNRMMWMAAAAVVAGTGLAGVRAAAEQAVSGTVVETMEGGGYTYALLDTGKGRTWIASRPFKAAAGEKVSTGGGYEMKNFSSPTLNRTFDSIYFVSAVAVGTNTLASQALPAGHPQTGGGHAGPHGGSGIPGAGLSGEVVETMNAGGYTYLRVKSATETIWAATDRMEVKVGDRVTVPPGEVMKNFKSATLDRTFDSIYFVASIAKEGAMPAGGKAVPHEAKRPAGPPPLAAPIVQPAGAISISEIHARKKELAGKEITVRGQITKFTQRVMDRNWIHITDGSGKNGATDLTVTTDAYATVGDIVTVRGKVAVDQDFGYGYAYPILIEKASVQK